MKLEYVSDAPSRRKWYVVPPPDHPISQWARPGFYTKQIAEFLLGELGHFGSEITAILRIARQHPVTFGERDNER